MANGHLPKLPTEVLTEIVTLVDGPSLASLRLSCRRLYDMCISVTWRGASFCATQAKMSSILAPIEAMMHTGSPLPTTLTGILSATFIVLPTSRPDQSCPHLARRLATTLDVLGWARLVKHLRIDLKGLSDSQMQQLMALPPRLWIAVESLTTCEKSWPMIQNRIFLDSMKSLDLPSARCLDAELVHARSLVELHLRQVKELHTLPGDLIQRCFPQLEKLSIAGHWPVHCSYPPFMTQFPHMDLIEASLNSLPKLTHLRVTIDPCYAIAPNRALLDMTDFAYGEVSRVVLERVPSLKVFILEPPWPFLYVATRCEGVAAASAKVKNTQEALDHYWTS